MKIVSANKSDVFDQYLSIMKRYNEKRIIKNANPLANNIDIYKYILRKVEAGYGGANQFFKEAGIQSLDELKKIIDIAYREGSGKKQPLERIKEAYTKVVGEPPSDENIGAIIEYFKKFIETVQPAAPPALSGPSAAPALSAASAPGAAVSAPASAAATTPSAAPSAAAATTPSAAPSAAAVPKPAAATATTAPAATSASAAAPSAAAPTPAAAASVAPGAAAQITDGVSKAELKDAISAASSSMSLKLEELAKKIENLSASTPDDISKTIKELDASIKQTDALKARLESLAERTEKELEAIKKLSKSIKDQSQSKSFLQRASEFFEKNKEVQKKSFIAAAAKYMAIAAATTAGIYYTYSYLSEDEEPVRGTSGDQVRIPTGESANQRGATGDDSNLDNNKTALGNILSDPNRRRELFESLKQMDEVRSEDILNKIARYYGASGYIMLQSPVTIKGELIEYVFPRAFRGGRDPIKDPARRAVTEDYFTKVYTQDTRSNRRITTRFESSAGSSDAQRIANYAFSTISSSGLFSGDGALFGDRGDRYGRGKRNVGRSDLGIAGTSRRKMTREERRAVNRGLQESEAIDYMSDEDLDFTDPMESFASGYSEDNKKYSNNLNLSTNNSKSYEFAKKADKFSNRYFKDAVKDLESDEFMKAYYSGYSKLHNQKAKKPKQDYNKLYDLHDETGEELIHKSHPKAISVAEAIGSGGLVENLNERSKSMQDIAKRTPSGNYRARYASKKN